MSIETKLAELGVTLPEAPAPAANYVPYVVSGDMVYVSGQISMDGNGPILGKLGDTMDVPALAVFRSFDDGSESVAAMKRVLDVGAFRAGQQGSVLLVGHMRPDTIAAITEWALGQRATSVTLAPASALLKAQ